MKSKDEWPVGHRPCTKCNLMLSLDKYHQHSGCLFGVNTVCKECRLPVSKKSYRNQSPEYRMWHRSRTRAKLKGLDFDLDISDIVIPAWCPVFNVEMKEGTEYCPSIDRFDPSKGYVKGNIRVISNRANMLKNNATVQELEEVIRYMTYGQRP